MFPYAEGLSSLPQQPMGQTLRESKAQRASLAPHRRLQSAAAAMERIVDWGLNMDQRDKPRNEVPNGCLSWVFALCRALLKLP